MKQYKNFYFIGIGGIGMSALARYFKSLGKNVLGYDKTETKLTKKLQEEGIAIQFEDGITEEISALDKAETLVIFTPAIKELQILDYFNQQGYSVLKRAKVLGMVTENTECIAVAGTHGKTTTSCLVAHLCKEAGLPFSAFLGGISENFGSNFMFNGNQYSVLEADEYDRSFLNLSPDWAIITSTDADHLDIYGDKETIEQGFEDFANLVPDDRQLFVRKGIKITRNAQTYAVNEKADYYSDNLQMKGEKISFDFHTKDGETHQFEWEIPGIHNVENATGALALLHHLGVDFEVLKKAIAGFKGIKRRYTRHKFADGKIYVDDYAHHPQEIAATIATAKKYPHKKLWVAFQPHTYSRTLALMDDFAGALSQADEIILADIYAAREKNTVGVTSDDLRKLMLSQNTNVYYIPDFPSIEEFILSHLQEGDLLITMGAGDIVEVGEHLLQIPGAKKE